MMNTMESIIEANVGLVWKIAKSFYGIPKNDLYQAGILGIIKAIQNYQENGECKFSTYAYNYIYGEMYLVACNKEMRYGKDLLSLVKKLEKANSMLAQELMRDPSIKELAEFTGLPLDKVEMALASVNNLVYLDEESEDKRNMYETISCESSIDPDDAIMLKTSIDALKPLEKDIINARYFEDLTQSETAKKLGITQVMVSRYETKSLEKIRNLMYM